MKLSDTQTILLSTAAQRDSGSLYPLPETLTSKAGATKSIIALVKHGLAEERETTDAAGVARTDGDLRYGMFVTAAGLAAIGIGEPQDGSTHEPTAPAPAEPRVTKSAAVLALLQREQGATLAELIKATGWLPHTTRAALTGLRKKGHTLEKTKRDDVTCYRIAGAA